jgi:hypothetical protein
VTVPDEAYSAQPGTSAWAGFATEPGLWLQWDWGKHVGQLLIATLTPLAVEAALHVSAELQQRAGGIRLGTVGR